MSIWRQTVIPDNLPHYRQVKRIPGWDGCNFPFPPGGFHATGGPSGWNGVRAFSTGFVFVVLFSSVLSFFAY